MLAETLRADEPLMLQLSGRRCRVLNLLGEGSQGVVYRVAIVGHGEMALKWYHPHTATEAQRRAIQLLVDRGAPDARYVWPKEIVTSEGRTGFGYVMPLRPPGYRSMGELLSGSVPSTYSLMCTLGRELADTFLSLHSEGLCYRDISFSNVAFDPTSGIPLILDTDNVGVDRMSPSAVLGSRRFMAPEIVRGEAAPSIDTDLYSLAVLLFYLLMVGHPLIGRRELEHVCWNEEAEADLLGRRPLFVLDPLDDANEPVSGLHDPVISNWPYYPRSVRDLFTQTFTVGLSDPRQRVRESVWRAAMSKLHDAIVQCSWCGAEQIDDTEAPGRPCWSCGETAGEPLRLVFPWTSVSLTESTLLHPHHLFRNYLFNEPIAQVTKHPSKPDVWGLRNLSDTPWTVLVSETAEPHEVAPGKAVSLIAGMTIDFGPTQAVLRG